MQQASNRQMDIEVEQEQEVGVLQQQIEAPKTRSKTPGSKTVPWSTPFWIRDDMIRTQTLLLLNNGGFPGELERSHLFGGIFDECIKTT